METENAGKMLVQVEGFTLWLGDWHEKQKCENIYFSIHFKRVAVAMNSVLYFPKVLSIDFSIHIKIRPIIADSLA